VVARERIFVTGEAVQCSVGKGHTSSSDRFLGSYQHGLHELLILLIYALPLACGLDEIWAPSACNAMPSKFGSSTRSARSTKLHHIRSVIAWGVYASPGNAFGPTRVAAKLLASR